MAGPQFSTIPQLPFFIEVQKGGEFSPILIGVVAVPRVVCTAAWVTSAHGFTSVGDGLELRQEHVQFRHTSVHPLQICVQVRL